MICPYCDGSKIYDLKHVLGEIIPLDCPFCEGTGNVTDNYPEWHKIGQQLKQKRERLGFRRSYFAKQHSVNVNIIFRIEEGLIEPIDYFHHSLEQYQENSFKKAS